MNRFTWDLLILWLIFAVMIIAPFEISFVSPKDSWRARMRREHQGLLFTNVFIDVCFIVDILLALNTAYFDYKRGAWVLDRWRIFKFYARTWFFPDLLSVIPYELLPVPKSIKILKMMKLVRLLKLLRVLKQPRIMSRLSKHCTIRAEMMTVMKYICMLMFQIHWGACVLRAIDGVLLKDCPLRKVKMRYHLGEKPAPVTDDEFGGVMAGRDIACPVTVLGFYRNQGMWSTYGAPRGMLSRPCGTVVAAASLRLVRGRSARRRRSDPSTDRRRYVAAISWTLGAMQGELNGNCTAELLLNFVMTMTGCIVLSLLVGDLCNVVTNMDPVRNDFTLAFDSLNNYIDEVRPPPSLRYRLREFMSLSEVVFREDYHRSLLERLSPGLLSVVAQHNLASIVVQLPFYVDTIKRAYNLREHMDVVVKYPHNPDDPQHDNEEKYTRRNCTVVKIHEGMLLVDVLFHNIHAVGADGEQQPVRRVTIPMAWVDANSYGNRSSRDRMARALYEENRFVVALTRQLRTQLSVPVSGKHKSGSRSHRASTEFPRRGRGVAATCLHGISTLQPRRRRDSLPRNLHVTLGAGPPRLLSPQVHAEGHADSH